MAADEAIRQTLQPLLEHHPVELLVLFGSQSRGQTHSQSDIDLGIMLDAPFDTWKMGNEIMALLGRADIDVIDLRRAAPSLAMAIATHGQVLFERNPCLFHQFQSLAARRYADSAHLRELGQVYIDRDPAAVGGMTPIDRSSIQAKLQRMVELLTHIDHYVREGWDIYIASFERQLAAQHALQLVIEFAIDINAHLIVQSGQPPPDDNYRSFQQAGQIGILSPELAELLAPAAGLRNRIVHLYEELDQRMLFQALQEAIVEFPRYVHSIQAWLEKHTAAS